MGPQAAAESVAILSVVLSVVVFVVMMDVSSVV